jgi:hypothetical protein
MKTKSASPLLLALAACLLIPALTSAASVILATSTGLRTFSTMDFAINGTVSGAHSPFALAPGTTGAKFPDNNIGVIGPSNQDGVTLQDGVTDGLITLTLPISVGASSWLTIWEAGVSADPFNLRVSTNHGVTYSAYSSFVATAATPISAVGSPESTLNSVDVSMSAFAAFIGGDAVTTIQITRAGIDHPDIVAVAIPESSTSLGVSAGLIGLCFSRRRGAQR